ncbi:MAG: hypothetical protein ACLQGP_02905 [Isosphaeraceae bacterium]
MPGAVINHDVCCKFCKEVFRAAPALASTRETTAAAPAGEAASLAPPGDPAAPTPNPGNGRPLGAPLVRERLESQTRLEEPAAISLEPPPPSAGQDEPEFEAKLETVRAEFHRLERENQEATARLLSLERALAGVVGEQSEIQAALRRSQTERRTLISQGLEEIERIRAQIGRPEGPSETAALEQTGQVPPAHPPNQYLKPALGVIGPRPNGHGRVLTTKPPQARRGPHRSPSGAGRNGGHLRESINRLSNCERLADGLITQLNTTRREKECDRFAFERILGRLQDELAAVKEHFATDQVGPKPSTECGASSGEDRETILSAAASTVDSLI